MKIGDSMERERMSRMSRVHSRAMEAMRIRAREGSRGYLSIECPRGVMSVFSSMALRPKRIMRDSFTGKQEMEKERVSESSSNPGKGSETRLKVVENAAVSSRRAGAIALTEVGIW